MRRLQTTRPGATAVSAVARWERARTRSRAQRLRLSRSSWIARQTPGPRAGSPGLRPGRAARTGSRSHSGPAPAPPPGTASQSGFPAAGTQGQSPSPGRPCSPAARRRWRRSSQPGWQAPDAGPRRPAPARRRSAPLIPPRRTRPSSGQSGLPSGFPTRRSRPLAWALALPHPRTARYARTVPGTLRLSTRTLQAGQARHRLGRPAAADALGLLALVSDGLVGEEDDVVTKYPGVDEAHGFLVAGLAEEALTGPEHDREDLQPQLVDQVVL